ncbi:MAG: 4-hydroxybenzoate octaprenyltransferase [Dokdonella sp.]
MPKPTKPPQETGATSSDDVTTDAMTGELPLPPPPVADAANETPVIEPVSKPAKKRAPGTRRKSTDATAESSPEPTTKESKPKKTTSTRAPKVAAADVAAPLPSPPSAQSEISTTPTTQADVEQTVPAKSVAEPAPKKLAAKRKTIPPSSEVQDNLPLPEAPPWSQPVEAPVPRQPKKAVSVQPADSSTRSMRLIDKLLQALPESQRARWRDYVVLMRMDRPIGALLLLWPTWWALWFAAKGFPSLKLFVIFTIGVFVMRSAGCVINDYADHDWLDGNVERTRGRPMAAGRVSRREAILLFVGLLLIAFALVWFTNPLTIALSFAGAALAAIYPFAKRVTHLAQVVLGAAFGWSIPMAFAATQGEVPALGWLLFIGNVLFSVVYDTEYAMVDRDEDIRIGAKSTAILFGDADRVILGVLMASFIVTLLLAGSRAALEWPWQLGLGVAAVLFGWQQSLIRDRERDACLDAFRNNNWVGFVIWLGLVAALAMA